jgi:hypothetical protein
MGNENQIIRVVSHEGKPIYAISIYTKSGQLQLVEYMWQLTTRINELKGEEILLHEWARQFQKDLNFRLNIQIEVLITRMTKSTKGFHKLFEDCKTMFGENYSDNTNNL